ncbi:MAG: hypothetical protein B9S33_15120 [Pedosphaera sp. Tous-C6FEB]|nr:MAG: hypothetical protein B9S33_15120 [Pedosphaera sp. Tous-C6FEB]
MNTFPRRRDQRRLLAVVVLLSSFVLHPSSFAAETSFQIKPGEFPPEGSAHYIGGELIALDHVNRTGVLRPDRTDAQKRGDWDLPLPFTLLPFGSLSYHGASAELRDIPIGTHLQGWFYQTPAEPKDAKDAKGKRAAAKTQVPRYERLSIEAAYNLASRLEDDFSHLARLQRAWRVDAVDLEKNILTVTGITAGKADAKVTLFQLVPGTRVWKGRGFGSIADLAVGQSVFINLTYATLKGPGRCKDIWLDAESRALATAHQQEVHKQNLRERGFAGWIDTVDNQQAVVTVTLFSAFDPKLKELFRVTQTTNDVVTAATAEDNLRTWDQINDRKRGTLLEAKEVPAALGSSGLQVKFKSELLIEGFRPKRVIRLWPGGWRVDDLPREERIYQ